jgi:hypothetical protein
MRIGLAWGCVVFSFACGGSNFHNQFDGGSGGDSGGGGNDGGGGGVGGIVFGDAGGGGDAGDGCSDAAKLVYVISTDSVLRSFNPATLSFVTIGTVNCPNNFASVNSMAVDRNANAYVNMSDGSLWAVSTKDASCTATSYQLGQFNRRIRGMGFSTDTAQGTSETFYTCTANDATFSGGGLAKINLPSFTLSLVGDYTNGLAGNECELTGTGDARLFGFYALLSPPKVAEITKATAATPAPITLTGVNTSGSYAFSFWGGDFWFYTQGTGVGSVVTHYAYSGNKTFTQSIKDTGFTIVGAGVSTCAPLTPPN